MPKQCSPVPSNAQYPVPPHAQFHSDCCAIVVLVACLLPTPARDRKKLNSAKLQLYEQDFALFGQSWGWKSAANFRGMQS